MYPDHLSPQLQTHLDALDHGLADDRLDAAQRKLEQRLAVRQLRFAPAPWLRWIAAGATACLIAALVMLPSTPGVAFEAVQKRLSDFHTLTLHIEQQAQGMTMPGIVVRMNREGDVRTDIGEATSVVVNASQHRVLTLLHASHAAMQATLPANTANPAKDSLAWLDAIRSFQGEARKLPQRRVIDGRPTTGWALDAQGMHVVIWADADALPHAIEISGNGQHLEQRMRVAMDTPIDPAVFSTTLPPGYHLMTPDRD